MDNEHLISNNLKLVHSCCKKFKNRGIEYDDLYGAGCLGLVKAAKAFNPDLGFCFSTYAVPVILGEIKRLFRDGGAVKVSRGLKELSLKAVAKQNEMTLKLGREPAVSEIAKELNVSPEEIVQALCAAVPPASISYIDEEGEQKEIEIGSVKSAEDEISDKLALKQIMYKLEENDRNLIMLRYFGNKTQNETAKELGMTQVQVSRREKKILKLMCEYLRPA